MDGCRGLLVCGTIYFVLMLVQLLLNCRAVAWDRHHPRLRYKARPARPPEWRLLELLCPLSSTVQGFIQLHALS